MDSFESLKDIWLTKNTAVLPDPEAMEIAIKKYKNSKKRNVTLLAIAAILLVPAFFIIIFAMPMDVWTTVLGEVLISAGLLMTLFLKLKTLKKTSTYEALSNDEFLKKIKSATAAKSKTNVVQLLAMNAIYFGYSFFIYDSLKNDCKLMVITYILITLFSLSMYFIFRPLSQKKSKEKAEKLLKNISELHKQL